MIEVPDCRHSRHGAGDGTAAAIVSYYASAALRTQPPRASAAFLVLNRPFRAGAGHPSLVAHISFVCKLISHLRRRASRPIIRAIRPSYIFHAVSAQREYLRLPCPERWIKSRGRSSGLGPSPVFPAANMDVGKDSCSYPVCMGDGKAAEDREFGNRDCEVVHL